jgi:hypothetical protein
MQSVNVRVSVMFVVSSTAYGISQRLLAYARISDALLRAAVARATETDKSQIYRVGGADDTRAAVSAVGLGKGVFVDAVAQTSFEPIAEERVSDNAKMQLLAAITPSLIEQAAAE